MMTTAALDRRGFLRAAGLGALTLGGGLAVTGRASAAEPKTLATDWQQQATTYWCAPTAVRIAISAKTGAPTQDALAAEMGTTPDAGTSFGAVAPALTAHIPGAQYTEQWMASETASEQDANLLWDRATKNVDDGFATVCNWIVLPGDYPKWGGNAGTIYHFTAIDGYDAANRTLRIADPAGATLSADLPQRYYLPVQQVATYCAGRGYFW